MSTDAEQSISAWMATAKPPYHAALGADDHADVCIIGAGIVGLTCAYLLVRSGKSVIVLNDGPVVSGETGRTTAHLSTALDDRYFKLERLHGENGAKLAAESHAAAIDEMERIIGDERISCDFARVDGYLFSAPGMPGDILDRELEATHRAGLETRLISGAPSMPFEMGRVLHFPHQAQLHPLKYLHALCASITGRGGRIFAHTRAEKITGGRSAQVETRTGLKVSCGAIIVATNTPVNDRLVIHTKQSAYRTYVIGATIRAGTVPKALYWDSGDPYHYIRVQPADGGSPSDELLIVGGEDHKTGQADDAEDRYARLAEWTCRHFPMANEIRFRWSGQVMEPIDGLAYIGRNPMDHDNVYIATGDSGNGMTHGTIAGMLISDLIHGRENPWTELYAPSRVTIGAVGEFARETLNFTGQYVDWLTAGDVEKNQLVPPGTGAIVRHGLTKVAVYRDADGTFHECSAICPHLGGIVCWNHAEKTWDCPVHGSRFDPSGKALNGPTNKDLHPVEAHVVQE